LHSLAAWEPRFLNMAKLRLEGLIGALARANIPGRLSRPAAYRFIIDVSKMIQTYVRRINLRTPASNRLFGISG